MKKSVIRPRVVTRSSGSDCVLVAVLAVMVTFALVDGLFRVATPLGA